MIDRIFTRRFSMFVQLFLYSLLIIPVTHHPREYIQYQTARVAASLPASVSSRVPATVRSRFHELCIELHLILLHFMGIKIDQDKCACAGRMRPAPTGLNLWVWNELARLYSETAAVISAMF